MTLESFSIKFNVGPPKMSNFALILLLQVAKVRHLGGKVRPPKKITPEDETGRKQ